MLSPRGQLAVSEKALHTLPFQLLPHTLTVHHPGIVNLAVLRVGMDKVGIAADLAGIFRTFGLITQGPAGISLRKVLYLLAYVFHLI